MMKMDRNDFLTCALAVASSVSFSAFLLFTGLSAYPKSSAAAPQPNTISMIVKESVDSYFKKYESHLAKQGAIESESSVVSIEKAGKKEISSAEAPPASQESVSITSSISSDVSSHPSVSSEGEVKPVEEVVPPKPSDPVKHPAPNTGVDTTERTSAFPFVLVNLAKYGVNKDNLDNKDGYWYYTVQRGDTLGKLASAFYCTVSDLAEINGISNPNIILVGQVLVLPL